MINTYTREELQKLSVKKDLRPIAKSVGIKYSSYMNKKEIINSILLRKDFLIQKTPKCYTCGKNNFIICVNVIVCKHCCTPNRYI